MNKTELIAAVAALGQLSKADAGHALEAVTGAIATALSEGESVSVPGFGTFAVADRAERQGRNPATGEAITIAASRTVKFKAGKTLKDAVQ